MIHFFAWTGFVVSFLLHISSFFEPKSSGGIVCLMQILCILIFFAASFASGNATRRPSRADCAGLAADLLIVFEPYTLLSFLWFIWLGHDKGSSEATVLRYFSAIWMPLFLTSAGMMARRSLARVSL